MSEKSEIKTPWQRVYAKFGMSQSQFSRVLGCHRSKVSLCLRDEQGLINGKDQLNIMDAADKLNIRIAPDDLMPLLK